jgi:hypothetical protein
MLFKKKNNPNSPVQVAVAPNEMVANIWKSVLEDNGVHCFQKSINLVASMYTAPITLQYQIMVMPLNAEKARELLAPFLENPDSFEDDVDKPEDSGIEKQKL